MERNASSSGDPGAALDVRMHTDASSGDSRSGSQSHSGSGAVETTDSAAFAREAIPPGLSPRDPLPHLFLQVENLSKSYVTGQRELRLFHNLSFTVQQGQLVAIVGQSGAGKSTLLHMLGALDSPTSGTVHCAAVSLTTLSRKQAARFRNREVGYVWQFHYLLPEFTAAENVAMPLLASGIRRVDALFIARGWLEQVGLGERVDHRSGELSGGEQQRVAIARALVTEPRLLLADEPTGDLDSESAESVFRLIENLHRTQRLTTVLVTHNMGLARRADRVMRLTAGQLVEVAPETL